MSHLKLGVFTFVKPSKAFLAGDEVQTVMAGGTRIAFWLAEQVGAEFMYDERIADRRYDILFINGLALANDVIRDAMARAVKRAGRIVWVQNDYMITAPKADGNAESSFRYAFRWRRQHGKSDTDYWTTVIDRVEGRGDFFVNWNMLSALEKPLKIREPKEIDLFYYGSFRKYRDKSFDAFFAGKSKMPRVVSSGSPIRDSPSRPEHNFQRYKRITLIPKISERFYRTLNGHGFGLYIEDARSHKQFHSPANRFYEMLSAGLPMVFEPDARAMLRKAGFDPKDFIVRNMKDIWALRNDRMDMAAEQRRRWWRPFREELTDRVQTVFAKYIRRFF